MMQYRFLSNVIILALMVSVSVEAMERKRLCVRDEDDQSYSADVFSSPRVTREGKATREFKEVVVSGTPSINSCAAFGSPAGQAPIHVATERGHDCVSRVLFASEELDVNKKEEVGECRTALHIAIDNGDSLAIKRLLDHEEIDVTIESRLGDVFDHAFRVAAGESIYKARQRPRIICLLLEAFKNKHIGVPPTVLSRAAQCGFIKVVEYIIKNYLINPNVGDEHGRTALHVAIRGRNVEMVKILTDNAALHYHDGGSHHAEALQNMRDAVTLMRRENYNEIEVLKNKRLHRWNHTTNPRGALMTPEKYHVKYVIEPRIAAAVRGAKSALEKMLRP